MATTRQTECSAADAPLYVTLEHLPGGGAKGAADAHRRGVLSRSPRGCARRNVHYEVGRLVDPRTPSAVLRWERSRVLPIRVAPGGRRW